MYIGPFKIENMMWNNNLPHPFDKVTGNFSPFDGSQMFKFFLIRYKLEIISTCCELIQSEMTQNSNILTQGRQTWDCLRRQSSLSANAYIRMYECFKRNLGIEVSNSLEWIKCTFDLMNSKSSVINFWEEKIIFDKEEKKYK